jgi:retron-type reverse transcriptase
MQVLQRQWNPTFSHYSYGFRPHRSAHQAVAQAQQYIADGYGWVIDLDLKNSSIDSITTICWAISQSASRTNCC